MTPEEVTVERIELAYQRTGIKPICDEWIDYDDQNCGCPGYALGLDCHLQNGGQPLDFYVSCKEGFAFAIITAATGLPPGEVVYLALGWDKGPGDSNTQSPARIAGAAARRKLLPMEA